MVGVSIVISVICVRYRDVPPLIAALTQFLFFASPVIWHADQLKFGSIILYINPVTYMLSTIRDPLIGHPISIVAFAVSPLLAVGSLAVGSLFYLRYRSRIAYWV
jgi:ABC-type polysaccharide/polyol phosphate export permease